MPALVAADRDRFTLRVTAETQAVDLAPSPIPLTPTPDPDLPWPTGNGSASIPMDMCR